MKSPRTGAERGLIVLVVLGAWSIAPPYVGPALGLELDVPSRVEVVDHVIPGALVVLCSAFALFAMSRAEPGAQSLPVLAAIGICLLAGTWETSSHAPLLVEGGDPESPWGAVLLHATPGPAIVVLSAWLLLARR